MAAEVADLLDSEMPATEQLERRDLREQLLLAITELSRIDQELIIGFHFLHRPYVDLAGQLGLSPRAIEGRLYRARAALRERLQGLA